MRRQSGRTGGRLEPRAAVGIEEVEAARVDRELELRAHPGGGAGVDPGGEERPVGGQQSLFRPFPAPRR